MKKGYSHIVVVADRSGSMDTIKEDAEGGINAFIKEQKEITGKATFALYQFDNIVEKVFGPGDIRNFTSYKLVPGGMTAMLDGIGKAIVETGSYLRAMKETQRPEHVFFVISTDGFENSSREYTYDSIKKMVKEQTDKYNWNFVFLAANQDAALTGEMIGTFHNTTYANTGAAAQGAYTMASTALRNTRSFGMDFGTHAVITEDGTAV